MKRKEKKTIFQKMKTKHLKTPKNGKK